MDKRGADDKLRGNTLRVYVYALKRKKVGVREVQRALRLSNPSLARYHLNKLKEMGLLAENSGGYEVVNEVKVDFMRDFLRVGTFIVPRFVFYAVLFTVLTAYLGAISIGSYPESPILLWFIALLALASAIFWFEAQKAWRSAPVG